MTAGQDKPPTPPALVDHSLDVGKQGGEPLDFVEYPSPTQPAEEIARVGFRCKTDIRIFQGEVRFARKRHFCKGRLARLAGTQKGHHGILPGGQDQLFRYIPRDHVAIVPWGCAIRKCKF